MKRETKGRLTCVGTGMTLGAHITPRARYEIENADVVFVLVSDGVTEQWIEGMNTDVRSLQDFYQHGISRKKTYKQMVNVMLEEVRLGKKVCGAFYGHPGVFALVPHKALAQAKEAGYDALMEPGVSAEDCLFADLGIDPGSVGCQQYETSQFMFYKRIIDPSAYLILWQIGVAGDLSHGISVTGAEYRRVLLDLMFELYPPDHPVIIYEASTSPLVDFRAEKIELKSLIDAKLHDYSTLVVPPAKDMEKNQAIIEKIKRIQA